MQEAPVAARGESRDRQVLRWQRSCRRRKAIGAASCAPALAISPSSNAASTARAKPKSTISAGS